MGKGGASGTTTTSGIDPAVMKLLQENYTSAKGVAGAPFQPYTGQMVAPTSPATTQGQTAITSGALTAGQPALNSAVSGTQGLMGYKPQQVNAPNARATLGQAAQTGLYGQPQPQTAGLMGPAAQPAAATSLLGPPVEGPQGRRVDRRGGPGAVPSPAPGLLPPVAPALPIAAPPAAAPPAAAQGPLAAFFGQDRTNRLEGERDAARDEREANRGVNTNRDERKDARTERRDELRGITPPVAPPAIPPIVPPVTPPVTPPGQPPVAPPGTPPGTPPGGPPGQPPGGPGTPPIPGQPPGAPQPSVNAMQGLQGLESYMNPYLDQVANRTLTDLDRFRQMATNQNGSNANMAGAWGGDRLGIENSETNRGFADVAQSALANLYSGGFNQASGLLGQDKNRLLQNTQFDTGLEQQMNLANMGASNQFGLANQQMGMQSQLANQHAGLQGAGLNLGAAGQLGQLGGQQQQQLLTGANAVTGAGMQQQAQTQAGLDAQMQEFFRMLNFPYQQQQTLNSALGMFGQAGNTQQTVGGAQPGGLLGGAGGLLGGIGALLGL